MNTLALLLVLQTAGWGVAPARITVGDTVWLSRTVSAAANVSVRLEPLAASPAIQPLGPPRWSYDEGRVAITYVLALFESGRQTVSVPAVELVFPGGRTEIVPAATVAVDVASVLPAQARGLQPKESLGPLPREPRRWLPVAALPAVVVLLTVLAARFARRRDPRPTPAALPAEELSVPLEEWIAAGESRAVATVVALRLRQILAGTVEGLDQVQDVEECARVLESGAGGPPARELAGVLRALQRARFSPAAPADVHEVVDDAERAIRAFQAARSRGR